MITITLRRAYTPREMKVEHRCVLCENPFRIGSTVVAECSTELDPGQPICWVCFGYFGSRNPAVYPTLAELEKAQWRCPVPLLDSDQKYERLWEEDDWDARRALEARAHIW